jgi:hypothetical protein
VATHLPLQIGPFLGTQLQRRDRPALHSCFPHQPSRSTPRALFYNVINFSSRGLVRVLINRSCSFGLFNVHFAPASDRIADIAQRLKRAMSGPSTASEHTTSGSAARIDRGPKGGITGVLGALLVDSQRSQTSLKPWFSRGVNSAAWSLTKSCMLVGISPVSLKKWSVMRS